MSASPVPQEAERLRHLRRATTVVGRLGRRLFPWRRHPSPYFVLLAEILLQHTPSDRVIPVFDIVTTRWPTFAHLAAADVDDVTAVLHPLGLQRRRAAALTALAADVVVRWRGRLPRRAQTLRRLPGVGRYTAGATSAVVFGRSGGFADAGMTRLVRRYFGLRSVEACDIRALVEQILGGPRARFRLWGLLDLARTYCRPRPACGECPLRQRCSHARLEDPA